MGKAASSTHPDAEDLELTAVLFALSDPARLDLVRRLAAGPLDVADCQPSDGPIPKSTLSHHLKTLRLAGVVFNVPQGRQRQVRLRRDDLERRFPGLLAAVLDPPASEGSGVSTPGR
ncbi:ArsR/SmtB family transcription factor [Streptomyces milbemycinicus]|uniref:ArsR/SmtB family transcription factor n=1 Tax=Streptomyces milbemycinicus TaxID=476552 RepID=A0ABW8M3D6_9ACTN